MSNLYSTKLFSVNPLTTFSILKTFHKRVKKLEAEVKVKNSATATKKTTLGNDTLHSPEARTVPLRIPVKGATPRTTRHQAPVTNHRTQHAQPLEKKSHLQA